MKLFFVITFFLISITLSKCKDIDLIYDLKDQIDNLKNELNQMKVLFDNCSCQSLENEIRELKIEMVSRKVEIGLLQVSTNDLSMKIEELEEISTVTQNKVENVKNGLNDLIIYEIAPIGTIMAWTFHIGQNSTRQNLPKCK